jgi:hypothetical protein
MRPTATSTRSNTASSTSPENVACRPSSRASTPSTFVLRWIAAYARRCAWQRLDEVGVAAGDELVGELDDRDLEPSAS